MGNGSSDYLVARAYDILIGDKFLELRNYKEDEDIILEYT